MVRNLKRLSRREMLTAIATGAGGLIGAQVAYAAPERYKPVQLENGQYTQSWFLNSFLELPDVLLVTGVKINTEAAFHDLQQT